MKLPAATALTTVLLFLVLFPHPCRGIFPPAQKAVLDSLTAWHHQSRPDLVDSLATLAIPAARAEDDSVYLLQLLLHSGRTRAAFGMGKQAEPNLREVCRLAATADDTSTWLRGLRWLSVSVGVQGRPGEAVQLYRELENLARAGSDSIHMGWAELGLAFDHYLAGRSDQAVTGYGQAAGILDRAGIFRGALWAYNGQGLALRQVGRFDAAMLCFQRSVALAVAQGDKLSEAMALNYLGRLEMMFGDPGLAIGYLERAAAIHQEFQHHREGLLPLLDIAQARVMQGRFEEAARDLETISGQAAQWGLADLELLAVQQLADIHLARGRPGAAVALCRRAMARPEFPSAMARTELSLRLAGALAARDSLLEALSVLEPVSGSGSAATTLQLRVAGLRSRYLLAVGQVDAALEGALTGLLQARSAGSDLMLLPLQTIVARAWFAQGNRDSALTAVDRAANQWERTRSLPADPRWRELRSEAAAEIFTQGAVMMMAGEEGPAAAFELIQRYKGRTLFERMQGPGRPIESVAGALSLPDFQARVLGPGEVYWEVAAHRESSVFFLVTADTVLGHVMTDGDRLTTTMRRLTDVLTSTAVTTPEPAQNLALSLFKDLPQGFRKILNEAQYLTWSPDGIWQNLPLALLRGPVGKGLICPDCELARIPAAVFLKPSGLAERSSLAPSEILAFLGPVPAGGQGRSGAAREVDWLKDNFRNVITLPAKDNPPGGGLAWATKGVIHVAAHTEVDARQPWNTTITLGPEADNSLQAADVACLDLQAGLTVLASCRTAGSRVISGEGLLGLTSAFLVAGVPTVVSTLWPVDDGATAVFMARFYANLADGQNVSGALKLAQETCKRDQAMAPARYWAGFVVVGDGSHKVQLQKQPVIWPAVTGLLILAVGFAWQGRRLAGKIKKSSHTV